MSSDGRPKSGAHLWLRVCGQHSWRRRRRRMRRRRRDDVIPVTSLWDTAGPLHSTRLTDSVTNESLQSQLATVLNNYILHNVVANTLYMHSVSIDNIFYFRNYDEIVLFRFIGSKIHNVPVKFDNSYYHSTILNLRELNNLNVKTNSGKPPPWIYTY